MVRVFKIKNPWNAQQGLEQTDHQAGVSLKKAGAQFFRGPWLCVAYLDGKRFFPTRPEWEKITLEDGDCVYFMPYIGGSPAFFFIGVILGIASVAVALSIQPPSVADTPEPDPVFDLKGQRNQNRLGSPIEDGYGKVRLWPSYGASAYNQYYGNDQFQFQLFCLGSGSWEIDSVQFEDTDISQFQETDYAVYQPGEQVTLFPDNVATSVEVGQIELYGSNEDEYIGLTGPFVANGAGTLTNRIEVDVSLPQGLYKSTDDHGLIKVTAQALFEYQEIDDLGDPVGDWAEVATFSQTLNTNTPQRFTYGKDVPDGRYHVRAARTNDAQTSYRAADSIEWVGLRAFLPSVQDYGDVTMLAIKARATNNLNDRSSNRVNVWATRMLPTYDAETGLAAVDDYQNRVATRSPVWAMANILRSGKPGIGDEYLDLEFFASEADIAETNEIYFDWIFDQRTTLWEAVKLPCFVNRSVPMLSGSVVSFVRDQLTALPSFFINPENTISGSFKLEKKLFNLYDNDGLEVEYTDPDSWKPEIVLCLMPGQVGNNPKRIKLQGVTDRQRAYDLGMYHWFIETNEREQVSVRTGLEGYIPTYGDLGRFGSDIPRWGQNGYVLGVEGNVFTLSENVIFTAGEVHQLAVRGKLGQDLGPYTVIQGLGSNQVISESALPTDQFYFDEQNEPPYFVFGVSNIVGKVARITEINPGEDTVSIKATVDDPGRHADFGDAPALGTPATSPNVPDAPVVDSVRVSLVPESQTLVTVAWTPAVGATHYILQQSSDGVDWTDVDTVPHTSYSLPVIIGLLYVRVAGVGVGIGPWASWSGLVGGPNNAPGFSQGYSTGHQIAIEG